MAALGLIATWLLAVQVQLVAGGDGTAIREPFATDFDRHGNMYIAGMDHQIHKIDPQGKVTSIAGTGEKGFSGDDGPATGAQLNGPHHLAVAPNGDVYVADTWNNRVRRIDARTGVITTIAGTGEKGFSGDGGPATKAQTGGVFCLAFDREWTQMYIADLDNKRVRKVDLRRGTITTAAGNGAKGVPVDGKEAVGQPLVDPRAIAVAPDGTLYILERSGNALRAVDTKGRITTVAGSGKKGHTGDGGPALEATFNGPKHLAVDRNGDVLIVDTENHALRRYSLKNKTIVAVAGTGSKGAAGLDGPPARVQLARPHGVKVAPATGTIYISDTENNRVLGIPRN